jgi:hypothetical protein
VDKAISLTGWRAAACRLALAGLVLVGAGARAAAAEITAGPDGGVPAAGPATVLPDGAADGGAAAGDPGPGAGGGEAPGSEPGGAAGAGGGLFEQTLTGAGAPDPGAPGAAPRQAPFTLGGYTRGDVFIGKVPDFRTGAMKAAYGELALTLKTAKERYGDGFAEARVRYGLQGEEQQTFLDLREAYVNTHLGPFDLRLGKQIIVWGRADALNPTNNLTPFDLRIRSPIEDDRRIGNVGARLFVRPFDRVRLEGVWMPLYVPSELPPVGLPQFVVFAPPRFPKPELKYGLLAGRVHLELPAFEMSVSYLRGFAPLPGVTLEGITFDPVSPQIRVSRTAYDHQVVGLDFSTAIGDVLAIRGEAAYRRPAEYQMRMHAPRPDLQYALGADRAFGPVSVVAQYLGRYVFDWRKENGINTPIDPSNLATPSPLVEEAITFELARINQMLFSQTARIQHLATVRVEWITAHDTLSVSALGLVNVTTREWLAAPRIGYRLSDAFIAYVGAEIFAGPDRTLFGQIDEILSAGYAELRYLF